MYRIRWLAVLAFGLIPFTHVFSQQIYPKQGGNFSLGIRTTVSAFSDGDPRSVGYGVGGHARVQVVDRVNTEWFADVLTSSLYNKAHRTDYHIGWSVMYYVIDPKAFTRKFTPYVVAGHCFDNTRIRLNGENQEVKSRWSTAVHAGIGCHYNITPRLDVSLTTQYMIHLGKELDAEKDPDGNVSVELHKNAGWEGHLLVSLSMNYKFLKLWKAKK